MRSWLHGKDPREPVQALLRSACASFAVLLHFLQAALLRRGFMRQVTLAQWANAQIADDGQHTHRVSEKHSEPSYRHKSPTNPQLLLQTLHWQNWCWHSCLLNVLPLLRSIPKATEGEEREGGAAAGAGAVAPRHTRWPGRPCLCHTAGRRSRSC